MCRGPHRVPHGHDVVRGELGIDDDALLDRGRRANDRPPSLGDDEVAPHQPADRPPVLRCGRGIDAHQPGTRRRVELPADPEQGKALPHQEAVADVGGRARVEAPSAVVEESEHPLAAAVGDLVEHGTVAALDALGFQQEKVRREFGLARGISRRLVEVGDDAVRRQCGIDCEEDLPRDLLVGADGAERLPADDVAARLHLDPHDFRGRRRRRKAADQQHSPHVRQGDVHANLPRASGVYLTPFRTTLGTSNRWSASLLVERRA